MNEDLVITRRLLTALRTWLGRLLGAAGWLLSLGLVAAGLALAALAALVWLLPGGCAGLAAALLPCGAVLGAAGTALLAHRCDVAARRLRAAPAGRGGIVDHIP